MTLQSSVFSGLQGVVAAETRLSRVDGLAGELVLAGYPLEEIASHAVFEEMVFLLWHDRLPNRDDLSQFIAKLALQRQLAPATLELLRAAAAKKIDAMDALRMAAGTLSLNIEEADDPIQIALRALAALPTLVAAYWRLLQGKIPLEPRADLTHAENYLYMLSGIVPTTEQTRALNTYLNTVCDHGLNASTFTARVIISTRSDMISALVGAIGALKGPLHGGAPGPALDMVFEIGTPENALPVIEAMLARGDRLMGFGHRVYKVRDPRADVLNEAAQRFFTAGEQAELYQLVRHVEQVALALLEKHKPGRNLQTNVEFFTALLLHGIGLPSDLFTPTFAIGRTAGWMAHCLEQQAEGRLIRPESTYSGAVGRHWVELNQR